jgi:hypothetical protein
MTYIRACGRGRDALLFISKPEDGPLMLQATYIAK